MRLTIDEVKQLKVGDKFKVCSDNENFYLSGWYNGIVCEVAEKLTVYSPEDFKPIDIVCVKYTPMKYNIREVNGEQIKIPSGTLLQEVELRKIPDSEPEEYWYETIE